MMLSNYNIVFWVCDSFLNHFLQSEHLVCDSKILYVSICYGPPVVRVPFLPTGTAQTSADGSSAVYTATSGNSSLSLLFILSDLFNLPRQKSFFLDTVFHLVPFVLDSLFR